MALEESAQRVPMNERRRLILSGHDRGLLLSQRLGKLDLIKARTQRHILKNFEEQRSILGQTGE